MESGDAALKRMRELDANAGIVDPATKRKAEKAFKEGRISEAEALVAPLAAPKLNPCEEPS